MRIHSLECLFWKQVWPDGKVTIHPLPSGCVCGIFPKPVLPAPKP